LKIPTRAPPGYLVVTTLASMQKHKQVKPLYKSAEWRRVRELVLRRDGYRCVVCGALVAGKGQARIDHRKSVESYPHLIFVLDNLRTLCATCDNQSHREKGGNPDRPRAAREPRNERFLVKGVRLDGQPYQRAPEVPVRLR